MLAILLLSLAAQDAPVAAPAAPASPKPQKEKRICRAAETTGTRMGPARECRTAAEWNALGGNISQRDLDRATQARGR